MENDVLQKKDRFPKTVSNASTLMEGWKSKPGNYINKYTEANNSFAFETDGKEEKGAIRKRKKKSHALNVEKKVII